MYSSYSGLFPTRQLRWLYGYWWALTGTVPMHQSQGMTRFPFFFLLWCKFFWNIIVTFQKMLFKHWRCSVVDCDEKSNARSIFSCCTHHTIRNNVFCFGEGCLGSSSKCAVKEPLAFKQLSFVSSGITRDCDLPAPPKITYLFPAHYLQGKPLQI